MVVAIKPLIRVTQHDLIMACQRTPHIRRPGIHNTAILHQLQTQPQLKKWLLQCLARQKQYEQKHAPPNYHNMYTQPTLNPVTLPPEIEPVLEYLKNNYQPVSDYTKADIRMPTNVLLEHLQAFFPIPELSATTLFHVLFQLGYGYQESGILAPEWLLQRKQ